MSDALSLLKCCIIFDSRLAVLFTRTLLWSLAVHRTRCLKLAGVNLTVSTVPIVLLVVLFHRHRSKL